MHEPNGSSDTQLKIGSLFSGYGGLDLAVEHVFNAKTDRRTVQRWGRYADAITRWEHITGRPASAPALLNDADGPRPAPAFVEWLMGLPTGWVTDIDELTQNQRITALGNGVLPL